MRPLSFVFKIDCKNECGKGDHGVGDTVATSVDLASVCVELGTGRKVVIINVGWCGWHSWQCYSDLFTGLCLSQRLR